MSATTTWVVSRAADAAWTVGRAGMLYRDLVPDRRGGRFVASHIRIPDPGPVPDWVHYHTVHVQMIFCRRGWVRVVYEDQGAPFVLRAGDCVLQPPRIRHRVLEASAGLEVVEITGPSAHETSADPALQLPTATSRPEREFGGQRFVRHQLVDATWAPWRLPGFEARELGIAAATGGLATAHVARALGPCPSVTARHDAELRLAFVLEGEITLHAEGRAPVRLGPDDAFVVPAGAEHRLVDPTADLQLFEVTLPAASAG